MKFEELWLGTQSLPLPCSEEILYCSTARLDEKGMDSPSSPLPPEDCAVSAMDIYSAMSDPKPRSSTKSQSLFNNDVDHTSEIKSEPCLVTNVSADDDIVNLPVVGTDAWSLLRDFESEYQTNETPSGDHTQHSTPPIPDEQQQLFPIMANITTDYLNCLEEDDCPLFADLEYLDELLCSAESDVASTIDQAAVDVIFSMGDYPEPQVQSETDQPHTSDLLANLITGTILVDPSLEGLLSNTTLDFSSVFGETVITAICNTSHAELGDDTRSVESCSPASTLQEVPDLIFIGGNSDNCDIKMERSRKRRISSTASSVCSSSMTGSSSVVMQLDAGDEPVKTKQARSSSSKVEDKFVEMRKKNNEASKRSRYARKQKFTQLEVEMEQLEKRNKLLTGEAERLEKMVNTLKAAMFKHVQKV